MARKSSNPKEEAQGIVKTPYQAVVQSDGFQEVIKMLEMEHPRHKGLTAEATMEQRAMKQLGDQAYETILVRLKQMAVTGRYQQLESTYEEIK